MAVAPLSIQPSSEETVALRLPSDVLLSDDQLFELCRLNKELRIERTSEGDLVIMPPVGAGSSRRNARIIFQLETWSLTDGTGVVFDSSAGFLLPNGAMRSPDAAWVKRSRLSGLSRDEKEKFLPLCPDFVIELRSPSDALSSQQLKLEEFIENGTVLGFLLDPTGRTVYVYRPRETPEVLEQPKTVSADPILPGFSLQLEDVREPRW